MKLTFLGAAQTVTGSKFLVETAQARILVDCGLFQGLKYLRLQNRAPFPVDPKTIDAVVLTHAHLDHSGYIPVLIKNGFKGPIYSTPATKDLCSLLLPDSGFLQEEEARFANKHGFSKHKPALPLYTADEAEASLGFFKKIPFETSFKIKNIKCCFYPAGHILGASFVSIESEKNKVIFSGDVGRPHDFLMNPPAVVPQCDTLLLESTYGNRKHNSGGPEKMLEETINATAKRGGVVLIPAFAVGRAQEVLYLLSKLKQAKKIPSLPTYFNSPMAIKATDIFIKHSGEHKLTAAEATLMYKGVKLVETVEQSKKLNEQTGPMIIISASGMLTGGRILHHLKVFGPDEKNTILLTGFQAAGTRGEALLSGAKEVKIHGQYVPIRAEIKYIDGLSAHADYEELTEWLKFTKKKPKQVFLVHGEPSAQDHLRLYLKDKLGLDCQIPAQGEVINF